MNMHQQSQVKHIFIFLGSLLVSILILGLSQQYLPPRFTQSFLVQSAPFSYGIQKYLLDIEEGLQKGRIILRDGRPLEVHDPAFNATIRLARTEEQKQYPEYKIDLVMNYPYSISVRPSKLETVLMDISLDQTNEFVDLFWKVK